MMRVAGLAAALACLALFVASLATHAATAGISYDEAWNASVAKNLADGRGFASTYHERVPFDPEVTTGPVVLLPLAGAIRLFGHGALVPPIAATVENLLLLALLAWAVWSAGGERRAARTAAMVAAWALFSTGPRHWLWYRPLGEVEGALLLVAGTLLLFSPGKRRAAAGALLLGLAPLAKAICLLGLLLPSLAWLRRRAAPDLPRWLVPALAAAPPLLWLAFAAASLGRALPAHVAAELSHLASIGAPRADLTRHLAALPRYLGGWLGGALLVALAIACLHARRTLAERLEPAAAALLGTGALFLAWWLALEPRADLRHLAVGFLCAVSGAALAIPALARSRLVLAAALALAAARAPLLVRSIPVEITPTRAQVAEVTSRLAAVERDPRALLVGWRWWAPRAFEYTLDGGLHFRDAARLTPADVAGRDLYLVRSVDFWNRERDPAADRWAAECERETLFAVGEFRVSRCPRLPDQ
jgi:hypothetical protein